MNQNNEDKPENNSNVEFVDEESIMKGESPVMSRKKILAIGITGCILTMGLAAGWVFGVEPAIQRNTAAKELSQIFENRGSVTAINHELLTFVGEGKAPDSAEVNNQKALGISGVMTNPAAFIYSNGKDVSEEKTMDVYLDFSSQRSRDFLVLNNTALKSMIEKGEIDLRIHPVPTQTPFSVYAPQALAEATAIDPSKSWDFLSELMKLSTEIDYAGNLKQDKILDMVANAAQENGFSKITSESISSGSFASWVLTVADDPLLKTRFGLPTVYLNNELLDQDTIDINSPEILRKFIKNNG